MSFQDVHLLCLFIVTASCIGEPVLLEQYVVLKNYQKQYHNDISLTKGYTVGVIEKHESGKYTFELDTLPLRILSSKNALPRALTPLLCCPT